MNQIARLYVGTAEAGNRKDKKEGRLCAVAQPAFFRAAFLF